VFNEILLGVWLVFEVEVLCELSCSIVLFYVWFNFYLVVFDGMRFLILDFWFDDVGLVG